MAKLAFPVPLGNLMNFMYQLKNNLWSSVSQTVSPDSLLALSGWAMHQQCTQFEPTIKNVHLHPPCAWSPWHLLTTTTDKFDHSQVNQTEKKTGLHLTFKSSCSRKIYVRLDLSFSGAAERRSSVFPS